MAAYAYKEVCHRADFTAMEEQFQEKYGREIDGDANYDGDYWTVAADLLDAKDTRIADLEARLATAEAEVVRLRGQVAALKGRVPDLPVVFRRGDPLPRFGIRWSSPTEPICVPMDDGYWTVWHYAKAKLADCQAVIRHKGHDADCWAERCVICGNPPSSITNHYFGPLPSHNFQPGPCSDACGHDRTTGEKA